MLVAVGAIWKARSMMFCVCMAVLKSYVLVMNGWDCVTFRRTAGGRLGCRQRNRRQPGASAAAVLAVARAALATAARVEFGLFRLQFDVGRHDRSPFCRRR